jgi:hypothetical protein
VAISVLQGPQLPQVTHTGEIICPAVPGELGRQAGHRSEQTQGSPPGKSVLGTQENENTAQNGDRYQKNHEYSFYKSAPGEIAGGTAD